MHIIYPTKGWCPEIPRLRVNGGTGIPLPNPLISQLPLITITIPSFVFQSSVPFSLTAGTGLEISVHWHPLYLGSMITALISKISHIILLSALWMWVRWAEGRGRTERRESLVNRSKLSLRWMKNEWYFLSWEVLVREAKETGKLSLILHSMSWKRERIIKVIKSSS